MSVTRRGGDVACCASHFLFRHLQAYNYFDIAFTFYSFFLSFLENQDPHGIYTTFLETKF